MACGVPVVCTDNSSLPEAVGDAAVLVDALSVDDIKNGIIGVLNNPRLQKQLTNKGSKQVNKFSWDKSAELLLEDLDRL